MPKPRAQNARKPTVKLVLLLPSYLNGKLLLTLFSTWYWRTWRRVCQSERKDRQATS